MTDPIRFEGVTRAYPKGVRGVEELSFSVPEGAAVGMVGRNGAGKTTTDLPDASWRTR